MKDKLENFSEFEIDGKSVEVDLGTAQYDAQSDSVTAEGTFNGQAMVVQFKAVNEFNLDDDTYMSPDHLDYEVVIQFIIDDKETEKFHSYLDEDNSEELSSYMY